LPKELIEILNQTEITNFMSSDNPYKVLIVAPSLDIMGGQAVQADLLLKNLRSDGAEVGFVPHNPRPPGVLYGLTKIKYVRTLIVSFFYLIKLLITIPRYDIIHIFSASYMSFVLAPTPAIMISCLFGKRIILNYRSGECRDHLERHGDFAIPIIKQVDRIITPSNYLVDEFADFGLKAESVFNLVDFSQFVYKKREDFKPKIIVARNLEILYNISASIRAYHLVKEKYTDASLTIVGAGSDEQNLRNLVEDLSLRDVIFTGRVERTDIANLYNEHDIFLNSSDIDNMPVSFLEAYSCGLAVVSTDAGGIPYICENKKTGLLVQRNDHKGLAEAILRIIEDDILGKQLTETAYKECTKYNWASVGMNWHRVYSELYNGKK
jgi:L-malate glycosyltransferase